MENSNSTSDTLHVYVPDIDTFHELSPGGSLHVPGTKLTFYGSHVQIPDQPADGLVVWEMSVSFEKLLEALAPGPKWLLTLTAGVEHVRTRLPADSAIKLYNANRLHNRAVAEHALAGILLVNRQLHMFQRAQAQREWKKPESTMGLPALGMKTLEGQHVVLLGYGHIGKVLEEMLAPHRAIVHAVRSTTSVVDRDAMLRKADWLVVLLPSTDATRGIINRDFMANLKPGCWITNQGRGDSINQDDLLAAVRSGHVGGAVLDVTVPEPLPKESPLWSEPNIIITPHVAMTTGDITKRAAMVTSEFLRDLAEGREPPALVKAGSLY